DFGLAKVSRNPVQHQGVDVRLELVRFHGRIDCLVPKFHRDIVRDELALAGVVKECFADLCARVDGTEYVATSTMIKPRDRAESFALGAFATARCAKKNKRLVFHLRNSLILRASPDGEAEFQRLVASR